MNYISSKNIKEEKSIIQRELPRTWSYEITGNRHASDIYSALLSNCNNYLTPEQQKMSSQEYKEVRNKDYENRITTVNKWYKISADQGLDDLTKFIERIGSRLAFQVLGFFLMQIGANISDKLKKLILENSELKDDLPYLKKKKHQEERTKYLLDFHKKIKNYESGNPDLNLKKSQIDGMRLLPPIDHFYEKLGSIEKIVKETHKPKIKYPDLAPFITELKSLLQQQYDDEYYIDQGLIQINGFTFIFRDYIDVPKDLMVAYSHSICEIGSARQKTSGRGFTQFYSDEDIRLIGSLKTLVPNLDIGGEDEIFTAWLFVKTPDGKEFPIDFYYSKTSLKIAGWSVFPDKEITEDHFPESFQEFINFSPHNFTSDALEIMCDTLENGLKQIPVSEFSGKYTNDYGSWKVGIKNGRSFFELEDNYNL